MEFIRLYYKICIRLKFIEKHNQGTPVTKYMRVDADKIKAVFIVFIFSMTSFLVISDLSGHLGIKVNANIETFNSMTSLGNNSAQQYVKYTLVLSNNSLIKGNLLSPNGICPTGAAFDSSNGYIYVTNYGSNSVSVINGTNNTLIKNIIVGSYPSGAVFDPSNGYLYVMDSGSCCVSVINVTTNTLLKNITVGSFPSSAAFDSYNDYLYTTNQLSFLVSVINCATNTFIKTVHVGAFPVGAEFDPSNGYVYVLNYISGTVSILSTTDQPMYLAKFTQMGLQPGTSWSATLMSTTEFSTSDSMIFSLINGSYTYSIGSVSGYSVSPQSGSIVINGTNVSNVISHTSLTSSSTLLSGIFNLELYTIIGASVVIEVIGATALLLRKKK